MPSELLPVIASWSGSAGTVTYARNQHGLYERARTTPTDPNTALQAAVRRRFALMVWRWTQQLTSPQRADWCTFAKHSSLRDAFGAVRPLTGQQMYIRCNVARRVKPLGTVDVAPTIFRQPTFTLPVLDTMAAPGLFFYTINNSDAWANETGAGMLLYISDVQPATVNFFKSPFRFAKCIYGSSVTPPANTGWLTDPWGTTPGARRWSRSLVVRADGRIARDVIQPCVSNV